MAQRVRKPPDEGFALYLAATEFDAFARQAFEVVCPGERLHWSWDLDAMCQALTEVQSGETKRLIITKPPRGLKSLTTNVFYPAFELGKNPAAKIICVSYGDELTRLHSENFRRLISSEWYRRVFPDTAKAIATKRVDLIATEQGGSRYAVSMNGAITGFGADLIILDDVMKAQEARSEEIRAKTKRFFDESLLSRLNDKKNGRIVCIAQRLHEDDIVGHLLEKDTFKHLNLPAIALRDEIIPVMRGRLHKRRIGEVLNPERETIEQLSLLEKEMGPRTFRQQYQQEPAPPESDNIRWSDIQFYEERPQRLDLKKVVISWDTASSIASSADYSVGTVWGHDGSSWLLLDVIRGRWEFTELLARVRFERRKWLADVMLVEYAASGIALFQELRRDGQSRGPREHYAPYCQLLDGCSRLPKEERIFTQVHRLYDGSAALPREAPFMEDLRRELMSFPDGRHDDQVDSISQFLEFIAKPFGERIVRTERPRGRERRRPLGFPVR